MFENIGGKIKTLATVICAVGIMVSLVLAVVFCVQEEILSGIGVLIGGCLGSWVGSFCLYGFGELIEETSITRQINADILTQLKAVSGEESSEQNKLTEAFRRASSVGSYTIPGAKSASDDSWRCKKCNSINHRTQKYCASCGEYK